MKTGRIFFLSLLVTAVPLLPVSVAAPQAFAQNIGAPVTGVLANASDRALDKLAKPGTFYNDENIRVLLPGSLQKASGLMKMTDKAGLTRNLTKSINDAAGLAAKEAKPIFRNSIENMTLKDAGAIASKNDGGTRYLQESASPELKTKIRPLVKTALGQAGAFDQMDKLGKSPLLASAGLSQDSLIDSVTDQTLSGIFKYMGTEEANLRANPLAAGQKALKGFKF